MNFLGNTFLSSGKTMNATSTSISHIEEIVIQNGIWDELYGSNEIESVYATEIPTGWDYDTFIHAYFSGNLNAGNIAFSADQVSAIRIKRREKGTYDWLILFEVEIDSVDDFNFEKRDIFARSGVEYEYAVVPVINGAEGAFDLFSILSEFRGIFIVEKNQAYHTELESEVSGIQRNQQVATINTIGRKYPYHFKNALTNYESGSAKGFFVEVDSETCELKISDGHRYRRGLMDFLTNGNPKILKDDTGNMRLISVIGTPSESINSHKDFVITNFSWEESGDCESQDDLYNSNLIDVEG